MKGFFLYPLYGLLLLSMYALPGRAQEVLSLEEAISIALEYNYDIQLAKIDSGLAQLNNTPGNAGMLPTISVGAGVNGSLTNTHLELASGDVQNRNNAEAYGLNTAVQLDWTLFDGMAMFVRKHQLDQLAQMGVVALRQELQATIVRVIQSYAAVIRQQQQLVAIDTAMSLAKVRMDIAQKKFEIGSAAKTDYLQAQVDYNEARAQYFDEEILLLQQKDSLLLVMGKEPGATLSVANQMSLDTSLSYQPPQSWMERNYGMQLARQQQELMQLNRKLTEAAQLPIVNLAAGYNFNLAQSGAGVVLFNRNYGPQLSLNLSLPLFDGGNIQRQKKVARQEIFRQDLIVERLVNSLNLQYRRAWLSYDNARKRYLMEFDNIKYAEENVAIQQARFRVGIANTLELREAETSYINALTRKVTAAYNLKITATRLLELENKILPATP